MTKNNEEPRDIWGETEEERSERLLTRDLERMVYVEQSKMDGVPLKPRDEVKWNAGYAAGFVHGRQHSADKVEETTMVNELLVQRITELEGIVTAASQAVRHLLAGEPSMAESVLAPLLPKPETDV